MIFQGISTSIAKKLNSVVIFRGPVGGGGLGYGLHDTVRVCHSKNAWCSKGIIYSSTA